MIWRLACAAWVLAQVANAIQVAVTDPASVRSAASTVAFGMMKYYTGNRTGDTPGNLPDPYFWWEAGAMFATLLDYQFLTGDTTYEPATMQALLHQVGEGRDFMPRNQTRTLGNDDQGFWALAAMSAAENKFPDPPAGQPQWLALVQAVFNQYATRWDTEFCNGGLRWQIFALNNGFTYKNSISNGCFFNIAARLARFTGNQTYAGWAEKIWDWETSVGLITPEFRVYDGAGVDNGENCTKKDRIQWSYNAGIFLHGAATMYNVTAGPNAIPNAEAGKWKQRVDGLWNETRGLFFNGTTMVEQACEPVLLCNIDQQSFKGYLVRWMAGTAQMATYTATEMMELIRSNAVAAAASCVGSPPENFNGVPGTACGFKWTGGFDGLVGVGEQMNALSALQYTLVTAETTPVTATNGGTSQGNANAGMDAHLPWETLAPITMGDRVAAGFLTSGILLSVVGGSVFVVK